jgi:hypothetical protein
MITKTIAVCLCVLGLAAPAALAQSPSQNGYGETQVLPQTPESPSGVAGSGVKSPSGVAGSSVKSQKGVAGSSVKSQKGVAGANVANAAPARSVNVAAAHSGGGLPFTGLDIGAVVLGALVLLAVGVGLRRATTTRSTP